MNRHVRTAVLAVLCLLAGGAAARADEPPPRIGPFVVDLHATFPQFPDASQLALSRSLAQTELPGLGLGGDLGLHIYLYKWRAVTFGIGGQVMVARARSTPLVGPTGVTTGRAVTERIVTASPQLSLNFGSGTGWSYLSGGLGRTAWSIVPDGGASQPADQERLKTLNWGGGARWFAKKHLAFSFDVRIYVLSPGTPGVSVTSGGSAVGLPGSPRTNLLVIGAGISVK